MQKPKFIKWLIKEDACIPELNSTIECFHVDYNNDPNVLDDWALHIRRNLIQDDELREEASDSGITEKEYLIKQIVPQKYEIRGPIMRSNMITEILFSDLLEFIYGYEVPRVKFYLSGKQQSPDGTDIIGYKFANQDKTPSNNDELVAAEVKAVLSTSDISVLDDAINDSHKDVVRLSYTIDHFRRKLKLKGETNEAQELARFSQKTKTDYKISYMAAGVTNMATISKVMFKGKERLAIHVKDSSKVVIQKDQSVFFIYGKDLMQLTHEIFERCVK